MASFNLHLHSLLIFSSIIGIYGTSYSINTAVNKAVEGQCNNWYSSSSEELVPFVFSKDRSLSLVTVTKITQENFEIYFGPQKIPIGDINIFHIYKKDDWTRNDVTSLLIQCRSAQPVTMEISWGRMLKNDISETVSEQHYSWEPIESFLQLVYVVSKAIQINSSEFPLSVSVTCKSWGLAPDLSPAYMSRFNFLILREVYRNRLSYFPYSNGKEYFYVTMASNQDTMKVCLAMYPAQADEDWLFNAFVPGLPVKHGNWTQETLMICILIISVSLVWLLGMYAIFMCPIPTGGVV